MNTIKALALAACATMFLSVSSARADWQKTKWGMSVAQVEAVKGLGARPVTADEARRFTLQPGNHTPSLAAVYRSGDLQFQAMFYFGPRGLARVRLKMLEPGRWGELISALQSKYGRPLEDGQEISDSRYMLWRTPREEIEYFHQFVGGPNASASVSYLWRNQANEKGL